MTVSPSRLVFLTDWKTVELARLCCNVYRSGKIPVLAQSRSSRGTYTERYWPRTRTDVPSPPPVLKVMFLFSKSHLYKYEPTHLYMHTITHHNPYQPAESNFDDLLSSCNWSPNMSYAYHILHTKHDSIVCIAYIGKHNAELLTFFAHIIDNYWIMDQSKSHDAFGLKIM